MTAALLGALLVTHHMQCDPVMQPSNSSHDLDRAFRISSSSLRAAEGRRLGFRRANGEARRRKTPLRPRSAPHRRAVFRQFPRHPHSIPSLCMCDWSGTQTELGSGSLRAENACRMSCAPHSACACQLTRPLAIASTRKQLAIAGTGLLMLSIFKTIFGLIA